MWVRIEYLNSFIHSPRHTIYYIEIGDMRSVVYLCVIKYGLCVTYVAAYAFVMFDYIKSDYTNLICRSNHSINQNRSLLKIFSQVIKCSLHWDQYLPRCRRRFLSLSGLRFSFSQFEIHASLRGDNIIVLWDSYRVKRMVQIH